MRLEVEYRDDEGDEVLLKELKWVSALHVLAVTNGPLEIVKYVYEDDPRALTEDVFLDACRHCSDFQILDYLTERVPSEYYLPEKIGPILLEIIDTSLERYDDQIDFLSNLFPQAMAYSEKPDKYSGCPFHLILTGEGCRDDFPEWLVYHVVESIPSHLEGFIMPPASRVDTMYEAIAAGLADSAVATFRNNGHEWPSQYAFVDFFSTFLPAAKHLVTLELSVPGKESTEEEEEDLFAAFPTDWLKTCQISSLSLCLRDDLGMLAWLVHMKKLKKLEVQLRSVGQSAVHDFCKALCQVLALGKLESLTVTASEEEYADGLFNPLLDAIASCPPLAKFHLSGLRKVSNANAYQDRMITIMKGNTTLEDVFIASVPASSFGKYWEDSISSQEEEKLNLIDYFARLNTCGRGIAIDSCEASALVKVLVETPGTNGKAYHLSSSPAKTSFTDAQVLYGLLRESPGTWSANALSQDLIPRGRGLKRKASK